jgi:hypothetical protein
MNLKEELLAFWYTHPVAFVGRYAALAIVGGLNLLIAYSVLSGLVELWVVRLQDIPNYAFGQGLLQGFLTGMPFVVLLSGLAGAITAWVSKPWEDAWLLDDVIGDSEACCDDENCEGCPEDDTCCKVDGAEAVEAVVVETKVE